MYVYKGECMNEHSECLNVYIYIYVSVCKYVCMYMYMNIPV